MNPQQKSSRLLPIGIGAGLSIVLLVVGYVFLNGGIASRASDVAPRDVVVSEITQNSGKVVWTTGQDSQGVIEYGTAPTSLNFFAPESDKSQSHSVDLTLLSPSTTYYFQLRIGDKKYDNSGVPWTFTTKAQNAGDVPTTTTSPAPTSGGKADFTTSPTCNETDCEKIKAKFFNGCDTQDYIKCIKHTSQ